MPEAILDPIEVMYLPSMPQVLLRFLHLTSNDHTTVAELATLVGQDPALSARILSIANSSTRQRGAGTKNLLQCLDKIGVRLARTVAASLVVQKVFSPTADRQQYDLTEFWSHSLRVAEVSRAIAAEIDYPDLEEAYLSGLLHDIGQLLLVGGAAEHYGSMLKLSSDESDQQKTEVQRLGTDHAVVGCRLLDEFNLQSFMADAILFHHASAEKIVSADPLSRIVWSAHVICCNYKGLDPDENGIIPDFAAVSLMTGIDVSKYPAIYRQCSQHVVSVASALGITETAAPENMQRPYRTPPVNPDQNQISNEISNSQLEEAVRNMAIMQTLQQDFASLESESAILVAVRESARILFGVRQFAFLLVHPEKPSLFGANLDGQPELLQHLEILLDPNLSLAATVAMENKPYFTFEGRDPAVVSLLDLQISRTLGSEGLLYVPLHARRRNIGVMVCGVTALQSAGLRQRIGWITSFANMAAISIENWRDMWDREFSLEVTLTNQFEQHSRRVIHEVGNPLSIIKNYLAIINRKLPDDSVMLNEMEVLSEEIDRVAQIVGRMSNLTQTLPEAGTLDVNHVIESLLVLYGESLFSNRGIAIEKMLDPEVPPVSLDRDSVKQILLNLWNNAADTMSDGGRLVISTCADVNQNGRAFIEIRVSDSGPGLPPDVMSRLFQPLEPDRRPGHSGVGLSVVAGLMELLDGCITCRSKAGQGTSYSLLFPKTRKDEA